MSFFRIRATTLALTLLALTPFVAGCDSEEPDPAITQPAYALNSEQDLVVFDLAAPSSARVVAVTGLAAGDQIVGMDTRPANGTLYLLAQSGRLYTLNPTTGVATPGASLVTAGVAVALTGSQFGVDFNPVPDRLRIVSNAAQNLRVNVDTGETTVDGMLAYASGDAGNGTAPQVVAAGYTNSQSGTVTATALYVLDASPRTLVQQNPPNAGTLNTIGALGIDITTATGFDIRATGNEAFAIVQTSGGSDLVRVNLTSGAATRVGEIDTDGALTGLAIPTP